MAVRRLPKPKDKSKTLRNHDTFLLMYETAPPNASQRLDPSHASDGWP